MKTHFDMRSIDHLPNLNVVRKLQSGMNFYYCIGDNADDTFNYIFVNESVCILAKYALKMILWLLVILRHCCFR